VPGKSRSEMAHADRRKLWLDSLNRFAGSGVAVEDFCKSEQVSVPSNYYWKQSWLRLLVTGDVPFLVETQSGLTG
jgi:hypothetical protein